LDRQPGLSVLFIRPLRVSATVVAGGLVCTEGALMVWRDFVMES